MFAISARYQFVHEGRLFHRTVENAQKEAQTHADKILGEQTDIDWSEMAVIKASGGAKHGNENDETA